MLGRSVLQKEGYYAIADEAGKREMFLKYQSIVPNSKEDEPEHAICLNFDTEQKIFRFEQDKEIDPGNRDYFFAFSAPRRVAKKFLSTKDVSCFYGEIFTASLKYLKENREGGKSKKWLADNISADYDRLLMNLQEMFYVETDKGHILNKALLKADQQQIFDELGQKHPKEKTEDVYDRFLNLHFFNWESKDKKKFPPISLIKIDGRHILEHEEHRASYINLVYYDVFERFFTEGGKKDNLCHICRSKAEIIGEVPLSMKFYGSTNPLYFENLTNKNAYKSFSICRDCLTEVMTGMKYVETQLRDSILGLPSYLIPSFEQEQQDFERKYKRIFSLLKTNEGYKEDIDEIESLVKQSEKKDFSFSLLFFDSPPASSKFDIVKLISDIEYRQLVKKLEYFDDYSRMYDLSLLKQRVSLNDLRYALFPSKASHGKHDAKLYRKDILDLLEAFLHEYGVNYTDIVKRFTDIYRRRSHRKDGNVDELAPFKTVLMLSVFNKIKTLKGAEMKGGNAATEVQKEEYRKFFEAHGEIYGENYYRQGLFLLGTVINEIVRAQKEKTSTFLRKLNLSGIPPRNVFKLVLEVQDFAQIYKDKIFEVSGVWGNIMDRLQGIENSGMKSEEVVFYILTGISYAKYLGMIHGIRKQGGENDDHNE